MSEGFLIDEFEMLSTARQQWRDLRHETKTLLDSLVLDWIRGKIKTRYKILPFKLDELIFLELANTHFMLFLANNYSVILIDFGELHVEDLQALAS